MSAVASIPVPAAPALPTALVRAGIIIGVMIAQAVQGIDTTIAAVALPHMQGSFSASQDEIAWVVTSYLVATGIMTTPAGWLAGRYGRKMVLMAGIAGFVITSIMIGSAQSLNQVVLFR